MNENKHFYVTNVKMSGHSPEARESSVQNVQNNRLPLGIRSGGSVGGGVGAER